MQEETQIDFQSLIDYCHAMAEKFLVESQEFYPFGAYIKTNGELVLAGFHDGDEFPLSQTVIDNLKCEFDKSLFSTNIIRAYSITYDTKVTNSNFPNSIDSIAMKLVSRDNNLVYYFPYKITDNQITFYESWVEILE